MILEIQQTGANPPRKWDVIIKLDNQSPIVIGMHSSQLEAEIQRSDLTEIISILRPDLQILREYSYD